MSVQKPKRVKGMGLFAPLFISLMSLSISMLFFGGCTPVVKEGTGLPKVLAAESFLADITQNIAGDRIKINTLIPAGLDPHSFEPSPGDIVKISESDILLINGGGLEELLLETITGASEKNTIVECSEGLENRIDGNTENKDNHHHEGDPHFWLNPELVKTYVQNINNALIAADPEGSSYYNKNADKYIEKLTDLDQWIMEEVKKIPEGQRLFVTNHESFGYYAGRYGFMVIGTIIPSSSSASSVSAKEIAALIEKIKATNTKAIFLETGASPEIANQIAKETGITIITELYTHSLTEPGGQAPTYIDMMKFNTETIVQSLEN